MTEFEKICGTCKHHKKSGDEWLCECEDSINCSFWTGCRDTCDDWEARNGG